MAKYTITIRNYRNIPYNNSLEFHSTDNYISQKALDEVLGSGYPALNKYESLSSKERKENNTKWDKRKNWKMFREMSKEDFEGTKLDNFIRKVLIPKAHS